MLASLGKKEGSRAEIWDRFFPRRAPSGGFCNCTTPTASSVEVSIPSSSVSSFSLSPRFLRSPIDSNKHLLFYDALCRGNEKTGVDCAALSLLGNACLARFSDRKCRSDDKLLESAQLRIFPPLQKFAEAARRALRRPRTDRARRGAARARVATANPVLRPRGELWHTLFDLSRTAPCFDTF